MKYITVLGSTGSIGTQTLEIASELPEKFKAVALSAGRNINLLTEQVKTHKPEVVAIEDENLLEECFVSSDKALLRSPKVTVVVKINEGRGM